MTTAYDLLQDAYFQTGIIQQQTQSIATYLLEQGLVLLNDIIQEWGGVTSCIPYQTVINFDMVANQGSYTFGQLDTYDVVTDPIVDVLSIYYDYQSGGGVSQLPLKPINALQYANIQFKTWVALPAQYLLRRFSHYSELLIQPLPPQAYPVTLVCKQRTQTVGLYDALDGQFPPSFLLNLKYRLVADIADSNGYDLTPLQASKAARAEKTMKGNNTLDLSLVRTEALPSRSGFGYGYGFGYGVY